MKYYKWLSKYIWCGERDVRKCRVLVNKWKRAFELNNTHWVGVTGARAATDRQRSASIQITWYHAAHIPPKLVVFRPITNKLQSKDNFCTKYGCYEADGAFIVQVGSYSSHVSIYLCQSCPGGLFATLAKTRQNGRILPTTLGRAAPKVQCHVSIMNHSFFLLHPSRDELINFELYIGHQQKKMWKMDSCWCVSESSLDSL